MKHTVKKVELKNGACGLFIDVPDATVMSFLINFRAGDYLSPEDKWDTAHAMEHIVLGANERYKKSTEFSQEFSKNGAYNNAATGTYHLDYDAECADFEAERILDLLCLSIEAPLFLKSEFEAEVSNIREELKIYRNNHFTELSLKIGEQLGLKELSFTKRSRQLKNIKLKDVISHYQKTHVTSNMRFIIAGQVSKRERAIIKRLESMKIKKGGERIILPEEPLKNVENPIVMTDKTVQNVYYRWETAIDHLLNDNEDEAGAALFGTLLSTLHSRIFGTAREKGLVYLINYGRYNTDNNSLWWIGGQVLPQNITPLFELYAKVLSDIARGKFTEQEMEETKQRALGNYQRGTQTVGNLVYNYAPRFMLKDEIDDYYKIPERIKQLKRSSIVNAARLALKAENPWAIGFYGAAHKVDIANLEQILAKSYSLYK
jgi:predicted Zn-dependent peptidase